MQSTVHMWCGTGMGLYRVQCIGFTTSFCTLGLPNFCGGFFNNTPTIHMWCGNGMGLYGVRCIGFTTGFCTSSLPNYIFCGGFFNNTSTIHMWCGNGMGPYGVQCIGFTTGFCTSSLPNYIFCGGFFNNTSTIHMWCGNGMGLYGVQCIGFTTGFCTSSLPNYIFCGGFFNNTSTIHMWCGNGMGLYGVQCIGFTTGFCMSSLPNYIFYTAKKTCNHRRGTSLSTFSLLTPRQKNVLTDVGRPPVHFHKKMYLQKGDVFLLYFFFVPPPSRTHVGGVPSTFSTPPPAKCTLHFGRSPPKTIVKGVGIRRRRQKTFYTLMHLLKYNEFGGWIIRYNPIPRGAKLNPKEWWFRNHLAPKLEGPGIQRNHSTNHAPTFPDRGFFEDKSFQQKHQFFQSKRIFVLREWLFVLDKSVWKTSPFGPT